MPTDTGSPKTDEIVVHLLMMLLQMFNHDDVYNDDALIMFTYLCT
jgi:hypothetical protein